MIRKPYQRPVIYSAMLHLGLLSFFLLGVGMVSKKNYVTEQSVMTATLIEIPKPTIKVENKSKEVVLKKAERVALPEPKAPVPVKPLPKPLEKPESVKPKVEKALKLPEKKVQPEKAKPEKLPPKVEAKPETKKVMEKNKEEKKVAKVKVENAQKQMEEKLWAEQLAEEDQHLSVQKAQQAKGEINLYNARILQAIREQWILPEAYSGEIHCQLLISLKSDGSVLNVQLIKSSGSEAFDRSATTAVYKASPLPVPKEPDIFNQMKEINLTVRP